MPYPVGIVGEQRVVWFDLDQRSELAPQSLAADGHLDNAVLAPEGTIGRHSGVVIPLGARNLVRPPCSGCLERRALRRSRTAGWSARRGPGRCAPAHTTRRPHRRRRTSRRADQRSVHRSAWARSGFAPVRLISPASPWAIWSYPARPPSGPSCPNPVMDNTTSLGLSSCSRSIGNPSRSRTPVRKFSTSTSAAPISRVSVCRPS